jgi:microcin C transport system substrate-binding protein
LFEGFKSGHYDLRQEATAQNWAQGYEFAAVKQGRVRREELKSFLSKGTYGLFFNTRRPLFTDVRVRKALTLLLDFPWLNKHLFHSLYERNTSYYPGSDFAANGLPTPEEKAILEPFRDQLAPEIFNTDFTLPAPQTEEDRRVLQAQAQELLKEAGYEIREGAMVNVKTGHPLTFEIFIYDKPFEKIALSFAESLKRIGIYLKVRNLDTTTYQMRMTDLDFDIILSIIPQSASLGNEQRDYFGSERANIPGTRNFAGVKSPVVDRLIEQLIDSRSYRSLVAHAKALDRVLLGGYYMIPAWHSPVTWVAYWDRFSRPEIIPKYDALEISTWWFDAEKDAKLSQAMSEKVTWWRSFWDWVLGWFS